MNRVHLSLLLALGLLFGSSSHVGAEDATPAPVPAQAPVSEPSNVVSDRDMPRATELGRVQIETQPDDATISINDTLVRKTPCTIEGLPVGTHQLVIKKVGYFLKREQIEVKADTLLQYSFVLQKPVRLAISTEPSGATVAVNGKQIGTSPLSNDKLRPTQHTILITKVGYQSIETQVTLAPDKSDSLHFVLTPQGTAKVAAASLRPATTENAVSSHSFTQTRKGRQFILTVFGLFALAIFLVEVLGP